VPVTAPAPERLAKIEEWAQGHERRCEERLDTIHAAIGELKGAVKWQRNALWGLVIALLAWAMAQLWAANQATLAELKRPTATTTVITPSGG
jgi:hypothetical protein